MVFRKTATEIIWSIGVHWHFDHAAGLTTQPHSRPPLTDLISAASTYRSEDCGSFRLRDPAMYRGQKRLEAGAWEWFTALWKDLPGIIVGGAWPQHESHRVNCNFRGDSCDPSNK